MLYVARKYNYTITTFAVQLPKIILNIHEWGNLFLQTDECDLCIVIKGILVKKLNKT